MKSYNHVCIAFSANGLKFIRYSFSRQKQNLYDNTTVGFIKSSTYLGMYHISYREQDMTQSFHYPFSLCVAWGCLQHSSEMLLVNIHDFSSTFKALFILKQFDPIAYG